MDRGAIHGLGLFETMLACDGALVFPDRHLARLRKSCETLGWPVEYPDILEIATELLSLNRLDTGRARVRLAITAGSGAIHDLTPGSDRLIWMVASRAQVPPESISACISPWPRNEHSPLAGLKCAAYAENLIALNHARLNGFDEAIFFNTGGLLCEAATANIFLVKNGTLLTPSLDSGCLPGITRQVVLELAGKSSIACESAEITREHLQAADEIFLTSSTIGVMPVSRLGDCLLAPGHVTGILRELMTSCYHGM